MTYISSQSMMMPLRSSVMQAQAALTQAQSEISTGVHADLGLALGAQTGTSLSLKSQIDQLNAFTSSNALASTRLDATSSALTSLLTSAQSMSATLLTASTAGGQTASLSNSAGSALQGLLSTLNTTVGGQYIFGGIKTDTAPVGTYDAGSTAKTAVDAAFQSTFNESQTSAGASSISANSMQAFLDGPFASLFSDSGWQANWSSASSQALKTGVAPGQSTTTSVSANETAMRQVTQAYTMLSEFSGANLSDGARAAVVSSALKLVNTAISGLTNLSSDVGVAQSTISSANDSMSAQVDVLKSNVGDLDGVDTYALSTKVSQLQTQLQASYELTSRLSQLSLVNYLTT